MPRIHYLDESAVRAIVESLTGQLLPSTPAFRLAGEAGRSRLLSALAQPRWPMHRTLPEKAATLHYHLNRDHPYVDGNKRMALVATETFLMLNRCALLAGNDELEALALGVADGSIDAEANRAFFVARSVRDEWPEERVRASIIRAIEEMPHGRRVAILRESRGNSSFLQGNLVRILTSLSEEPGLARLARRGGAT